MSIFKHDEILPFVDNDLINMEAICYFFSNSVFPCATQYLKMNIFGHDEILHLLVMLKTKKRKLRATSKISYLLEDAKRVVIYLLYINDLHLIFF